MPRVQLQAYLDPGRAEVFLNIKTKDNGYERLVAVVDTGAQISLLPTRLLNILDYRIVGRGTIIAQQAGIARQQFTANIALVKLSLEDQYGVRSVELTVPILFAEDTDEVLIGFDGILDRAKLYIDILDSRTGWIELAT